jgi:hypothetical protein
MRTDMTKVIGAFRAYAPKKGAVYSSWASNNQIHAAAITANYIVLSEYCFEILAM